MADKTCFVAACIGLHYAKGMCKRHYERMARRGTTYPGKLPNRAVYEWLSSTALAFSGDECLICIGAPREDGYHYVSVEGRQMRAHRYVCEEANGKAATGIPKPVVMHLCNNGAGGCVNPRHLQWGTSAENSAHMVKSGRSARGERQAGHRLKAADIPILRKKFSAGQTVPQIAKSYGLPRQTIGNVIYGRSWAWVA